MEKAICIGKQNKENNKPTLFKATANTPRVYRLKFRRDLMQDMARLARQHKKRKFDIPDLEVFENVAYVMALQADPNIGSVDEWLDKFDTFDIYEVLPQLLELWGANVETQVESKKNMMTVTQK